MTTALVLAGGGARGAYEAGVLGELLPWLEARGERPAIFVGTSVGAFNAAYLASMAHLPAADAAEALIERWLAITQGGVIRPILSHQVPRTVLRYAAELAGLPGIRLRNLLDPSPLRATLADWMDWDAIRRNVADGRVQALAVVATSAATERAVVWVQRGSDEALHQGTLVDTRRAEIYEAHLLASASIPVVFPPVEVPGEGWFFDGGTRLNTPIKPAIDLGADRVAIVATHAPFRTPAPVPGEDELKPDFADGALELVQATLVDPLINDLRTLGKINMLIPARRRQAHGYRRVPWLFAGPHEQGRLGRLAREALEALQSVDVLLLSRLIGGPGPSHDELLSYFLFRPEWCTLAVDAGRADATELLRSRSDVWRTGLIGPQAAL